MYSVFEPRLSARDKYSVVKALFNNNISGTSPIINEFEEKCANEFNRKYAVAVSNGSVSLDLAFQILNLEEGDEVIIPSFTIISCLSAVIRTKAKPVFCDVDKKTWNMTLDEVKNKVTDRTKAILMVHIYGLASEAKKIEKFCNDNNIYLIEDSAEAHGQVVDNKKCGSFGEISTLSFYANKHITTGEGGLLLTDSTEIYEKAKEMRNLGFKSNERFKHSDFYWNYRLGGMQAALGISQINSLNRTINEKKAQGEYYHQLLVKIDNKVLLPQKRIGATHNHYWVFGIVLNKDGTRDKVVNFLEEKLIQTRPFFWPLHKQEVMKNFKQDTVQLPNSEYLGSNGFYIPIGKHITKKDQRYIASSLIEAVNNSE
jgi:perosamine synthetase